MWLDGVIGLNDSNLAVRYSSCCLDVVGDFKAVGSVFARVRDLSPDEDEVLKAGISDLVLSLNRLLICRRPRVEVSLRPARWIVNPRSGLRHSRVFGSSTGLVSFPVDMYCAMIQVVGFQ